MAEIPGIPDRIKRLPVHGKRVTTSKEWIAAGPLVPWMLAYLQWVAEQPNAVLSQSGVHKGYTGKGMTTLSEKTAKAGLLSKRRISTTMIRTLEQRQDAIAYVEKLRADLQFRARELMQQDIATNIEARREGLQHARGYYKTEDGKEVYSPLGVDHKAIKGYTDWVPEVAFPKKAPEEGKQAVIHLHIGSKAAQHLIAKALDEPEDIQDVDVEVLDMKQLTDGGDDGEER